MANVVTFVVMLAIYSAIMIYIGYRGYKATKNVQDWLVAGRRRCTEGSRAKWHRHVIKSIKWDSSRFRPIMVTLYL